MPQIKKCELPPGALLQRYREPSRSGGDQPFTDCYSLQVPGEHSLPQFVLAFYTTWLFKLERFILRIAVNRPSTDKDAEELAQGDRDTFAAWRVEGREDDQLLMCDFLGRTRSWLMVESMHRNDVPFTLLRFGSAVVPANDAGRSASTIGWTFRLLVPFHKLYSRALLRAAAYRLRR